MKLKLEGEVLEVNEVTYGYLPMLETDGGDFYVAKSAEEAGKAAREYWQVMAEHDPREFTCIIGEKALLAWALGKSYAVGSVAVGSLDDWLDLSLDAPEETFANYDGMELDVELANEKLIDELGFVPTVAYRCN